MAIYCFLLAGVIIVGAPLCSKRSGKSGRIIYCIAAALVFIFISAMRFQVGNDYTQYAVKYFDMQMMFPEDIMKERMEKGFLMPLYALHSGYDDYTTVFIYTSIVIYSSLFYLIYKRSSDPWISTAVYLCLGLYFNSLCFLRQVMAAMVIVYAYKYFENNDLLRYTVLVLAASAFHWSALIMLPMYFLMKIKPGYIYLGIITVGTVLFCIFSKTAMMWIIDHFYMYRGYDPFNSVEAANGLSPRYTVMFAVLFVICFIFRKRLMEKNAMNAVYINSLMYTVVFEAMGIRHAILSRFSILTAIPPIVFMTPDLVKVIREWLSEKFQSSGAKKIRILNICAMSCLSLYFVGTYAMLMMVDYNGTVPYVSQIDRPYDLFVAPEDQQIIVEEGSEEEYDANEVANEELEWIEENDDELSEEELIWIDAYKEFLKEYDDSEYDEYFEQFYEEYLEGLQSSETVQQ